MSQSDLAAVGVVGAMFAGLAVMLYEPSASHSIAPAPPAVSPSRPPAFAGVECNRFALLTSLDGSVLTIKLDTDLPEDTVVMVQVSRSYWEVGVKDEYSADYFSARNTVGQWRLPHKVDVRDDVWIRALRTKQAEMAPLGLGFDVASISDNIRASMVIPINQPDPEFGHNNANLEGAAVRYGTLRTVQDEAQHPLPMSNGPLGKSPYPNQRQ